MATQLTSWPPELQLLLACCQSVLPQPQQQEQEASEYLHQLATQVPLDWHYFLQLVKQHDVQPLVYQSICRFLPNHLPTSIYQNLRQAHTLGVRVAFQQLLELVRLLKICQGGQVQAVPLKGMVAAQRIFGDITMRRSVDIDLLVNIDQLAATKQILASHGYQCTYPDFPLTPRQQRVFANFTHHCHYEHPERHIMIELHWRPYAEGLLPTEQVTRMLNRVQTIQVANQTLPCLADGDLLLYLCLHGAKHHWSQLKWLCDIAGLLGTAPAIDWTAWQTELATLGVAQHVTQGLRLAQALLSARLPFSLSELAGQAPLSDQEVADWGMRYIQSNGPALTGGRINQIKLRYALGSIALQTTFAERWQAFQRLWIMPEDWRDFPLPDSLFPLYYALRPFTWFWRYHLARRSSIQR